jgi:Transglycosylase
MKTWARAVACLLITIASIAVLMSALIWKALTPKDGEWSHRVSWRGVNKDVSVPVLLRWGTHPLVLPLINQRIVTTKAGRWLLQTQSDGSLHATCTPCSLRLAALGPAPLLLNSVQVHARRAEPEAWRGTVSLGDGDTPVLATWHAKLQSESLVFKASMPPTAIEPILAVLGSAVPEMQRATVAGRFGFDASGVLGAQGWRKLRVTPQVLGVSVSGLGTEALLTATPPSACQRGASPNSVEERISGWLPRAVIAAEDQRFFEHPGFDVQELVASWTQNQRGQAKARGGSTITQQLAKMIYTGDERKPARKVREWLYAVEMERTLGKGRILQLYVAMAPWGGDVCGAEAAARHYIGKPAHQLAPHEAAWLASLLTRPDAQLALVKQQGSIDQARAARVIEGLRPMPKWRRDDEVQRLNPWQPVRWLQQPSTSTRAPTPKDAPKDTPAPKRARRSASDHQAKPSSSVSVAQ